jgi:hypothetical protein
MTEVQAVKAVAEGDTATLAEIYDQKGVVFLAAGKVYATRDQINAGEGYITVTDLASGLDHDLQSNTPVTIAVSAVLVAAF